MTYENPNILDVASEYVFGVLARPHYHAAIERALLAPDDDVLEFGSGGGACSRLIADALGDGGSLTCLDINDYWLGKVEKRIGGRGNVHFLHQDVTKEPLSAGSFDLVFIHFVLHDIERSLRKPVVDALVRGLRPGGRVFVREPTKESHGMPIEEIRALMGGAGLRETYAGTDKKLFVGPFFEALYETDR